MIAVERSRSQDAPRAAPPPLIEGDERRCPFCRYLAHERTFTRYGTAPDYPQQTRPVWKCPKCRSHFALDRSLD